jgi:3'-phosphoadenosine 5'-phosphosulfate sulfotransferase (PAPS reductase)/FAD synthetase
MITIENETFENLRVDFAINRGEWFGDTWVVLVGAGFESAVILVEAGNAGDAIDELLDSRRAYLLTVDESEPIEEWHSFGGNYGVRYNNDLVRYVGRCSVNYFASRGQ